MRRLRIDAGMSRRLGSCGLSRNATVRLYAALRDDLENGYPIYRPSRHPDDNRVFLYFLSVKDGPTTHRFVFTLDDSTSPDDLFIVDVRHEAR
jgi:hypothetical protein